MLRSAVRDRLIGANPCEGVRLPRRRRQDDDDRIITREEFTTLLRHVPDRYRAVVALAAGAGLRWGECAGLRWDAVDLDAGTLRVLRVAVEINGHITIKPYPKSRAGRREVPLPGFAVDLLTQHRTAFPAGQLGEVFTVRSGNLMSRHTFRARVWRPSLVRAGLLGSVSDLGDGFLGTWTDKAGTERRKRFVTREEAVSHLAQDAGEGLRFHDLRHCYATWLVSEGVPVNDVAGLIGHEQISTTLNRYTHASRDRNNRARAVFADFSLTSTPEKPPTATPGTSEAPPA